MKSFFAKILASYVRKQIDKWAMEPEKTQKKVFDHLISKGKETAFGQDNNFKSIANYGDFAKQVPIRDYEGFKGYIERIIDGEKNVLWRGLPLYFAKTSGTTSGVKYIPITKESMPYHIKAARDAILCYIQETKKADFVSGKMIFLQGSPVLEEKNGIKIGRLSGISAHYVPSYLQSNRLPSWKTNCIEDWEEKIDKIVDETMEENMTLISGIPPWVQMYFEKLEEKSGKKIGELFENFNLFIYGGVNYEPYRARFEKLIGKKVDSIELFPASEGFFAYQDSQRQEGMLLLLNSGIFYEFVKADEFDKQNCRRYTIGEVEMGVDYVLIISTNAGLWGYNTGDTVRFTSLKPHRVVVSGRVKHYISAFGEHVIAKEVENALKKALEGTNLQVNEFTVAPEVAPNKGLPHHQWIIEFEEEPEKIDDFAREIDQEMQRQNVYYKDLREGNILKQVDIEVVKKGTFSNYMKSIGKLGGQNKLPRLTNDRKIADELMKINNQI